MGTFLEALGRSQAVSNTISGVQTMQQNNLAIQNAKQQQAITEYQFKKIKEEEEAGNALQPMDPILNGLSPSVKKFWEETLGPTYFQKGATGGTYIRRKDMKPMQEFMQDKSFQRQSGKEYLTDLTSMEQQLQNQLKQMDQPDAGGKVQKVDEDAKAAIGQRIALIQRQKVTLDQMIDVDTREQQKEILDLTKTHTPESIAEYQKTGNVGALVRVTTETEKPLDQFQTFKSGYLQAHPNAGGEEVVKAYENATTKPSAPVDNTDRKDKTYSRILAQSSSDAWRRTQAKYPKSGMSFNFTTGEMNTGGGGDPAALDFYEQERNKAVTARLKKVGLYGEYGDLHTNTPQTTKKYADPTKVDVGTFYKEISAQGSVSKGKKYLMDTYGYPESQAERIIKEGIQEGKIK